MMPLNEVERQALVDGLTADAGPLEEHISGGGTFDSYIAGWKAARDAAARAVEISPELGRRILGLPMGERWLPGDTVRDYLGDLLAAFWAGQDVDQKYGMTGSSDWQYDLYEPLLRAGLIPGWVDGHGLRPEDETRAGQLIDAAIKALTVTPFATQPGY